VAAAAVAAVQLVGFTEITEAVVALALPFDPIAVIDNNRNRLPPSLNVAEISHQASGLGLQQEPLHLCPVATK
jgi:hypothetical protein